MKNKIRIIRDAAIALAMLSLAVYYVDLVIDKHTDKTLPIQPDPNYQHLDPAVLEALTKQKIK